MGGGWHGIRILCEEEDNYLRLSRNITHFNLIVFSAGATFAATGMFFFIGLFPKLSTMEFHIWWFPILAEAILFATQILLIAFYWYSWGKIGNKAHQLLGYGFAVATFFQTLMIDTLAAGMLTPGGSSIPFTNVSGISLTTAGTYIAWWFNATTWNLQLMRLAASISFFGFVLAIIGVFHYVDRRDAQAKKFWDWVTGLGVAVGLTGFAAQPAFGMEYVNSIFLSQPEALSR